MNAKEIFRWFLVLLVVGFGLFVYAPFAVLAQSTDTPTPSATFQPYFDTATPFTFENYNCLSQGTLPSGFGTLTPDASWYLNCSRCNYEATATYSAVTQAPTATEVPYTPIFEGTAVYASQTPTATVAASGPGVKFVPFASPYYYTFNTSVRQQTINLSVNPADYGKGIGLVFEYQRDTYAASNYAGVWRGDNILGGAFYQQGASAPLGDPTGVALWIPDTNQLALNFPGVVAGDNWSIAVLQMYADQFTEMQSYAMWPSAWSSVYLRSVGSLDPTGVDTFEDLHVGICSLCSITMEVHIIGYIAVGSNSPSPTPVAAGYCGSIVGTGAGTPTATPAPLVGVTNFLPVPYVGSQYCYDVIPSVNFDIPDWLEWLFGTGFSFSGLGLCLRLISFGSLDLGITKISLDAIAIVLGGVAIFRWVMRTAT